MLTRRRTAGSCKRTHSRLPCCPGLFICGGVRVSVSGGRGYSVKIRVGAEGKVRLAPGLEWVAAGLTHFARSSANDLSDYPYPNTPHHPDGHFEHSALNSRSSAFADDTTCSAPEIVFHKAQEARGPPCLTG